MTSVSLNSLEAMAKRGEEIYRQKYKDCYEASSIGKFVVIDLNTEKAFLGESAEKAFLLAKSAESTGPFHLIRVGFPVAYRVSHTSNADHNWL